MLWLALHLPRLSLELYEESALPLAIVDGPANRPLVHACNAPAREAGLHPGLGLAAARSLCRELVVHSRDGAAEAAALQRLALWSQQFTSTVVLQPPAGLLLEIGGSLTLFDGLANLLAQVEAGLAEQGFTVQRAVAPTPLGSRWLAWSGRALVVTGRAALEEAIAALPLSELELDAERLAALRGMGLRRAGDCLGLPRAGLARRLGPDLIERLDRALGRHPDPRRPFTAPAEFEHRLPLPTEVESVEALLFAARRLLLALSGFLRAREAGILNLRLLLEHRGRPDSVVAVGLVAPSRDGDHLLRLLREQLDRFDLPAPVEALILKADRLLPLEQRHDDLFSARASERPAWTALVERLRARLGAEAVQGLGTIADHRPEKAWRTCPPGEAAPCRPDGARPLWLLPEPRPLDVRDGRPWLGGALRLGRGPERVESGWWDGDDTTRDYFVAEDRQGKRFWIYRDRRGGGWFMQGLFG